MDLILIIILTLAIIPAVLLSGETVRIVLGIPFVLFFPGYCLVATLFPKKGDLPTIERLMLSLGLSLVISPLIGLILNYTSWGVRVIPALVFITVFIITTSTFALIRRQMLPKAVRFKPEARFELPGWFKSSRLDRTLGLIVAFSIIVSIGLFIYVITAPKEGEKFTEFYILGTETKAADYPRELKLGEQAEVILGIENQEQQDTTYSIEIQIDGDKVGEINPINIVNGGKWEQTTIFLPQKIGENQRVDFLLYKSEKNQPYHTLQIWIDVENSE